MSTQEHVHDCTGPTMTCPCGFKFKAARFCVSFDVYDNETKRYIVNDSFGTDSADMAAGALKRASERIREAG